MTSSSAFSVSSNLAVLQPRNQRLNLTEPSMDWWDDANKRLSDLNYLECGWDGYKGRPMRFEVGCFVREILKICGPSAPSAPQIVPGADGDVQIEWHHGAQSIEIEVRGMYSVSAWRTSEANEDGEEVELTADFTILDKWLKEFNVAAPVNATTAA